MNTVLVKGEYFEYWESSGHVIARSLGPSGVVIEVPYDIVVNSCGSVIPQLVGNYLRENLSTKTNQSYSL